MNLFHFGANTLAMDIWLYIQALFSIFPKLLYLLSNSFLSIIDILQFVFRKLAGLDVYYIDGVAQEGDIVYHFLRGTLFGEYPVLTNVFWSLIILGVILLVVSIIISVIRSEYASDKIEPKSKYVMQGFKSLIFMAIIPIIVLFGVYLSNVVLQAVDSATSLSSGSSFQFLDSSKLKESHTATDAVTYINYNFFTVAMPTTTTTFSGVIFNASCYSANRVRQTENIDLKGGDQDYNGFWGLLEAGLANNWNNLLTGDSVDQVAGAIDEAFANYVQLKDSDYATLIYTPGYLEDSNISAVDVFTATQGQWECQGFDRNNVAMVWYYYNLWFYNFLIAFGAGIMISILFINLTAGLMGRLIELLALFLVAAPLISIMPLDNGNAYNAWRGKFIGKTLMVIGAVGGMNIVFLILPYLNEISFFNEDYVDYIVSILFMFVALNLVKSFIGMISSFVKSEDLNESGEKIAKDLGTNIAKAGMLAAGAGGLALKGATLLSGAGLGAKGLKGGAKMLLDNRLSARQGKADAYNTEREGFRHQMLQDEGVASEAAKDVRYSGHYATMDDRDFEVEIRRDKTSYENALRQRKIDISSEKVRSKYGDEKTADDYKQGYKQMAKERFYEWSDQSDKDIGRSVGDLTKTMLQHTLQSSSLYGGWKDQTSADKLAIKLDIPIVTKYFKDKANDEELQKAIKEAELKQKAMKDIK
ncbi:MAG: hypothetical protein PHR96_01280 [Clostridia bacterium]|nr:hypothetical protein [Clostridia bacterium]